MTVREAINWLQLFSEPEAKLTIDIHYPGDEWPHNKNIRSFRNEIQNGEKKVIMAPQYD